MNGLSLFSGTAIGELAFKTILPDYRTVGYVEWDKFCQEVIRYRIEDGALDDAPIFGDIREFNEFYAKSYTGKVDWLSAGFPCQPFSVAGRRTGEADERNQWPATRDAISIIRPRFILLENVPGLLAHGYIRRIFGDLAEIGYDCEWDVVGASDVGAPHRRKRLWIMAYDSRSGTGLESWRSSRGCGQERQPADTLEPTILRQEHRASSSERLDSGGADVADTTSQRRGEARTDCQRRSIGFTSGSSALANTTPIYAQGQQGRQGQRESRREGWWTTEPNVGRVADGVAARVDRLKAAGNGWVVQVVRAILRVENGESPS